MAYVPLHTLETLAHKARRYDALRARVERRRRLQDQYGGQSGPVLTQRKREVLELTCQGMECKEIAASLGVTVETVRTHRKKLFKLANAHTSTGLAMWAVKHGLVDPWGGR